MFGDGVGNENQEKGQQQEEHVEGEVGCLHGGLEVNVRRNKQQKHDYGNYGEELQRRRRKRAQSVRCPPLLPCWTPSLLPQPRHLNFSHFISYDNIVQWLLFIT